MTPKPDCTKLACPACGAAGTLKLAGMVYYCCPLKYGARCESCGVAAFVCERTISDSTLVAEESWMWM